MKIEEEFKEEVDDEVVSKELRTILPIDVHNDLTAFAKSYTKTGLGKWDYGTAIRIALDKARMYDILIGLMETQQDHDERITKLEGGGIIKSGVKTFGGEIDGQA